MISRSAIAAAHGRARFSRVCLCGLPKRHGFSFCFECFAKLSYTQREGLRAASTNERDTCFYECCSTLALDAQTGMSLHPVLLSEEQLDALFLGATVTGKRAAIAALLDWARIQHPREMDAPTNQFEQIVEAVH